MPAGQRDDAVVTICTPSFNRADLVGEMLNSVIAQTFPNWEVIAVDDGSADDSVEVIEKYAARDRRIRIIRRDREPKGACTCRNIAVERAVGRYVLFLDTDDLIAPHCLEQRVGVMEANPDLDFAIFPMLLFSGAASSARRYWNIDNGEDDLVRLLRLDPVCQGTGTLWRRDSFVTAGMWDENLCVWQDVDLHLRAFSGRFKYAKRLDLAPDTFLRESDASLSRADYHSREKVASRLQVTREAVRLLREIGREDLLPEVRYFCSNVVLGSARSGDFSVANRVLAWAEREGVLSAGEARSLKSVVRFRRSRLDRFAFVRRFADRLTSRFVAPATLGAVQVHS